MCDHTVLVRVNVGRRTRRIDEPVPGDVHVDACIASDVLRLNELGLFTLGSCCGRDHEVAPGLEGGWITVWTGHEGRLRELGVPTRSARAQTYPGAVEVSPNDLRPTT